MADIDLKLTNTNGFDIAIENGVFLYENTYRSHIITSLFENQRLDQALAKNKPYHMRGGSPAEILLNYDGFKRGSLLWTLLYKATVNLDLINKVQTKSETALQWLVENKYIKSLTVEVESVDAKSIKIKVNIVNNDNATQEEIFTNISTS